MASRGLVDFSVVPSAPSKDSDGAISIERDGGDKVSRIATPYVSTRAGDTGATFFGWLAKHMLILNVENPPGLTCDGRILRHNRSCRAMQATLCV